MPIGEDAGSNFISQGFAEIHAALEGQMAEGPPIEAPPADEPSGYEAALSMAAAQAEVQAPEQSMGMER